MVIFVSEYFTLTHHVCSLRVCNYCACTVKHRL